MRVIISQKRIPPSPFPSLSVTLLYCLCVCLQKTHTDNVFGSRGPWDHVQPPLFRAGLMRVLIRVCVLMCLCWIWTRDMHLSRHHLVSVCMPCLGHWHFSRFMYFCVCLGLSAACVWGPLPPLCMTY